MEQQSFSTVTSPVQFQSIETAFNKRVQDSYF